MNSAIAYDTEPTQPHRVPISGPLSFVELTPSLQHYAWGDPSFIPQFLQKPNPTAQPYAELWIGAHPDAPSFGVIDEIATPLNELIAADPNHILHPRVSATFGGELPFLLKVLAAAQPLSLQVHPSRERANIGFASEDLAGIPRNSAQRNYRDRNHKPELIVALTDFVALRGFRPLADLVRLVKAVPELRCLAPNLRPDAESVRELYGKLMTIPQTEIDLLLASLISRLEEQAPEKSFEKTTPEYWILRASRLYVRGSHYDRGLFSFYLLNIVPLRPGEGLFLPAGILHAYLEGAGIELMANSNNVLRGGLTPKHIDVPELLRNIVFDCEAPRILTAEQVEQTNRWIYRTPAEEFQLSRIELEADQTYVSGPTRSIELFLVESCPPGQNVSVTTQSGTRCLRRGEAFLIAANQRIELRASSAARLFSARVPEAQGQDTSIPPHKAPLFRGKEVATLAFGTSGLRGLVTDITDLEAYINTRGFLEYLVEIGESQRGGHVSLGCDLRPSSNGDERSIMRAVARAVIDTGFRVENLGCIPTPALTLHGLVNARPSIMITGSHIPFDRNGIKFNKITGEILKADEPGILRNVGRIRMVEYSKEKHVSLFDDSGMFRERPTFVLPEPSTAAREFYIQRYLDFFGPGCLNGVKLLVYQHSAVGRDLLVEILRLLGAEVFPRGRSETFVPIDTEALSDETLSLLQNMADEVQRAHGPIDAVISTDGDSDRPLVCGLTPSGKVYFIGGDILGIVVARHLRVNSVAVPISVNDAVDRCATATGTTVVKTRIGSPHVIGAMEALAVHADRRVAGWEANGGFLTARDLELEGRILKALPTRDAVLPILGALCSARMGHLSLYERFRRLPTRFSKSGLIDQCSAATSKRILKRFGPEVSDVTEIQYRECSVRITRPNGHTEMAAGDLLENLQRTRGQIENWFSVSRGYDQLVRINILDGVRLYFRNGDIVHLRPSGNAPQLRIYAVANTDQRVDEMLGTLLKNPGGVLERGQSSDTFSQAIQRNIQLNQRLLETGQTPEIVATVSGSAAAKAFWQKVLDEAQGTFRVRAALSFHEDLPTNQAFGILLLWQRLKPHIQENRGALASFVFGDGTRSTPFTETDNAQKPAIATFVRESPAPNARFLTMVELAMRHFIPVQQFLRRSGFEGLVVKWGDEVQIPTRDLAGTDALFQNADVVRFVSIREITTDEAKNKDWVGIDNHGNVTAFIPRRPIAEMEALAEAGLVRRHEGRLYGGINLGSIAISSLLLDALLLEFGSEVNETSALRKNRPALDPEFFTALTVAAMEDQQGAAAWSSAMRESEDVASLAKHFPDIIERLRRVIYRFESQTGRKLKMVALDFGDQYWGDIGQHAKIREFYMALNDSGPAGEVVRALAGLTSERDTRGNIIVDSFVAPGVNVENSVLIGAHLSGQGTVSNAVLVGTRARNVQVRNGFDILSTVRELRIDPRGGTYKTISGAEIHARSEEHVTTLFLPAIGTSTFRVLQTTDLRNKAANYAVPILGNPLSFQEAHDVMGELTVDELRNLRATAESEVLMSVVESEPVHN